MSQYSEMMGSFIRTGNYPMEANYVFATEADLKEFYNDPINATTLHKGLLKIVEDAGDGNQALYWVVSNDSSLEFVKLIDKIDIKNIEEQLKELINKLDKEIKNREELSEQIENLIISVSELKEETKALAGTDSDDIISYLQTLPYKSLTEVSNALNKFLNTSDASNTKINTLPELQSFLYGYSDTQKLHDVLSDLKQEISGTPLPSKEFETLKAIEDFVRVMKTSLEGIDKNLQSELDNTQIGVGLSGDGSYNPDQETNYLKDATSVMNALKTLDSLIYQALKGITITTNNTDVVDLVVRKETDGYVIGGALNLSNVIGNDLLKKEDGLYFNVKSTYNEGTLSLYVNDKLISQHVLGFSNIVESAYYDSSNESLVIVFKLLSGEKQTITIPVGTLIRELEVDNSKPEKVVELAREIVIDGPDKLSADVRIYNDKHNILKKIGNTLSVDGTSDNITHNDEILSSVIETIKTTISDNNSSLISKVEAETTRAIEQEKILSTAIDTKIGVVTIKKSETSDLQYILYVDGKVSGEINIPTDKHIKSVSLENNSILRFTFVDSSGTSVTDIDLSDITVNKLADGVVTVDKIADGAISEEKLDKELQALLTSKNIKYISIDELDTLKDPLIQTGLYYVYNLKTEDYTQIVGILLVQTDTEYHQVTQHFFSNYNMSSDDKTHNDKQATYYKRHYGVNSSDIDTGTWTDWEDAVVNNVNLQNILNSLDTTYLKRGDNTGTFGSPIFNNATFSSPVFNNVSFKQPFISGDFNSIPFLKGSNLFLTDNGFKYAGDITNFSGCTLGPNGLKINDDYFFNSSQGLHIADDIYLNTGGLRYKDLFIESYRFIYGSTDLQNTYHVAFTSGQFIVNCSSTIDIKGENILINNLYGNGITITNSNDIIVTGKGLLSSDSTKQSITTLWNTAGSTTSLTDYANITDDTITINGKSITVSPQKEILSFAEIVDNVTITQASTTSWDSIVYDKTHKTFLAMANTGTELQPVYTYYNNWTTRENYCAEAEGVPYSERIYTDGVSTYYFNGTDLVCIGRDIPTVELSNLDTVLGSTYVEVGNAIATKNGNRPFRYIVVDDHYFVGYIDMFGDNLRHCLTQEFTTNYLLDEDGSMSTSHDHKLHKYVRYYNISWSSATDWRGKEWPQGTWTVWNSPVEDVEARVTTLESKMVTMTVDEYDALTTKDANTYYFLKES